MAVVSRKSSSRRVVTVSASNPAGAEPTDYWLLTTDYFLIRHAVDGDVAGARDVVDAEGAEHLDEGVHLLAVARSLDEHARVRDVHDLRAEDRDQAQDLLPPRARRGRDINQSHLALDVRLAGHVAHLAHACEPLALLDDLLDRAVVAARHDGH